MLRLVLERLGEGGLGADGQHLNFFVFVWGAEARRADAVQEHEMTAIGLNSGVWRAGAEQASAATGEASLLLGLARGGEHGIFAALNDTTRRLGGKVARTEAILADHHEPTVFGDGEREDPVAGAEHKKITLSFVERVMTMFLVNPENPAVGVELFVLDGPARGRRHARDYLVFSF